MSTPEKVIFINFSETVAAGTGVTLEELCPFDGVITHLTLHYPAGCNGLVGIAFKVNGKAIFPYRGMIRLDAATPVYQFVRGQKVKVTNKLQVDIENADSLNAHTPSIIVVLEGTGA